MLTAELVEECSRNLFDDRGVIGDVVVVWNAHAENAHADWRRKAFFMVEFIMSVILLTLAPLLVEMEGNGIWEYREWIISAPIIMGRHIR